MLITKINENLKLTKKFLPYRFLVKTLFNWFSLKVMIKIDVYFGNKLVFRKNDLSEFTLLSFWCFRTNNRKFIYSCFKYYDKYMYCLSVTLKTVNFDIHLKSS